ncbi:MAG: methylenetetrahydrofolate reductase C-terminal domain-containing protein [Desulfatirhabdiaceae bacterium]
MLRVFRNDLLDPNQFVVTLELVPGREHGGKTVDTVMRIAADAFSDGRISAVSMTDNPGGNPSLSPDVLGYEVFKLGLDVIVHFTCRDMNRVGIESRALQLAMMGMKNILVLTGDYAGQGFAGQGAPVFDLDSVSLQCLLTMLSDRINTAGDPDGFLTGCAVSPFKYSEAESFAQYAKLCRKVSAGAQFVITQLGYDARKFQELIRLQNQAGFNLPFLGSVYILTPGAARLMNQGKVPGAVVPDSLLQTVQKEWTEPAFGRKAGIERAARLGVVLKGLGYRGIHIGGVHRSFEPVVRILDRMTQIEDQWKEFLGDFAFHPPNGFYAFGPDIDNTATSAIYGRKSVQPSFSDRLHFHLLELAHRIFFNSDSSLAPVYQAMSRWIDARPSASTLLRLFENVGKQILLGCRQCGDCAIQYVAFQCPESGCPKHTRNGACGGSRNGRCEVNPDRWCIWHRAYQRWAPLYKAGEMINGCIPPRKWELDHTSSWLNFHLGRDHQNGSADFSRYCCSRAACSHMGNGLCRGRD